MKKSKKAIATIIVAVMLTSAFSAIPFTANAAEVNVPKVSQSRDAEHYVITSGDYRYENIDGNSIVFWEYLGSDTDLVVPEKIDGKTVTMLARGAFYNQANLKSITLPKTLTYIKGCAFWGCTSLESVVIPDGVSTIEEYAFAECYSLKSVTIPKSVTSIGDRFFFLLNSDITIYGYEGSYAQNYVNSYTDSNKLKFVAIDGKKVLKGDANGDGVVNVSDVTHMQFHISGSKNDDGTPIIDENDKAVLEALDLNGDGKLTVSDVTELQMYIAAQN
ncbi:MAG: hypothetical protein EGR46_11250 [Ruminococcus sp.]|uniref:leucine-rich repeat protein n=1 Tax=Ruminococcus sp. TaxID=41978 RepID=UPI0025FEBAA0|nr:leucine-rich repeat protein [Ruminococcus sp.]MBD9049498.1 hypothetical protein [Ruminococcus sp.]